MRKQQYRAIIYFIGVVVAITLATQVYWNYKNYQEGKAQLVRDVQTILDKSIDDYYQQKASKTSFDLIKGFPRTISRNDNSEHYQESLYIDIRDSDSSSISITGAAREIDSANQHIKIIGSSGYNKIVKNIKQDSSNTAFKFSLVSKSGDSIVNKHITTHSFPNTVENNPIQTDSVRLHALQDLTTKIIWSFDNEKLDLTALDSMLSQELHRKNVGQLKHKLKYNHSTKDSLLSTNYDIVIQSKSALLPKGDALSMGFGNTTKIVFKRNLLGILLSLFLVGAIISALLYLLKIIQEQKQLAEIKNDFISNITHEFKTPIATIGVAMESIQHFNATNDLAKTKKYVDMSSQQVSKLNIMVEKLLETATLDSQALALNKQETNLSELLQSIVEKYNSTQDKNISFSANSDQVWSSIDAFHIENAIDNIFDNAIKYGGNEIDIACAKTKNNIQITISDNGNNLLKSQANQIFEKFYRVPKGNMHNVKGFGIGLYYTKTIIEKHGGTIQVTTQPTTFKITLPYV